jgi:hypothetical protein
MTTTSKTAATPTATPATNKPTSSWANLLGLAPYLKRY